MQETWDMFDLWVRKIPWRRAWQPIPEFLPGESHGQGSLVGYSACSYKSWTQLKWLGMHTWIKWQLKTFSLRNMAIKLHSMYIAGKNWTGLSMSQHPCSLCNFTPLSLHLLLPSPTKKIKTQSASWNNRNQT